jgi:hypothetical protein
MDQRIADFIRDNRREYTREAITQQLIDAGYQREAIEATWAALDTPDPDDTAGEGFWGRFFLMLIGVNLAILVVVGLGTGSFASPERIGLIGVLAVALGIGALIAWGLVAAIGPSRMGRTSATVFGLGIPLVIALLIGGSCYALVSSLGPPPHSGTLELEVDAPSSFAGSGPGTCTVGQSGGGFSIFGQPSETPFVTVFVDNYSPTGGIPSGVVESLSISIGGSEAEPPDSWSTYGVGAPELESEVSREGLEGRVTFTDLPADAAGPEFEGPTPEPISGTVTWNCD